MPFPLQLAVVALSLSIEAVGGYPRKLENTVRHPIAWIGALIGWIDATFNQAAMTGTQRRLAGIAALAVLLVAVAGVAAALQVALLSALPRLAALLAVALLATVFLAQRSLWAHIAAVVEALEDGSLTEARSAVAHVVGRDPRDLDRPAIGRAAIESLAENFSDAVVAPSLWLALLGLPGIAAYKTINTADSMIGHKTERHRHFGWAAARLDDLVNLPASRLSVVWIALAAASLPIAHPGRALRAAWRDARCHNSPNAGYPEAAMAGALGLRLAGPRAYEGHRVDGAWMGDGRAEVTSSDLRRALELYRRACAIQIAVVGALALLIWQV